MDEAMNVEQEEEEEERIHHNHYSFFDVDENDVENDHHYDERRTRQKYSGSSSHTFQNAPQILTMKRAAELSAGLDASDVLECYLLQRQTVLHGIANNSIPITKTALGLRYRGPTTTSTVKKSSSVVAVGPVPPDEEHQPPTHAAYTQHHRTKRPFTLTLEYGSSRIMEEDFYMQEPAPRLVSYEEENDDEEEFMDNNNNGNDDVFVTWDNEAVITYTTTSISSTSSQYTSANFMASLTGAVLNDLLKQAVMYINLGSRRRYQPWQVVVQRQQENANAAHNNKNDKNKPIVLLRSSNDYDFVSHLFAHLRKVGVQLQPLLTPTVHVLQLQATSIRRKSMITPDNGRKKMGRFYQNLYTCLDELATATVRKHSAAPISTSSPTAAAPILQPSNHDGTIPAPSSPQDEPIPNDHHVIATPTTTTPLPPPPPPANTTEPPRRTRKRQRRQQQQPVEQQQQQQPRVVVVEEEEIQQSSLLPQEELSNNAQQAADLTRTNNTDSGTAPTMAPPPPASVVSTAPVSHAEAAATAAAQAQQAADQAADFANQTANNNNNEGDTGNDASATSSGTGGTGGGTDDTTDASNGNDTTSTSETTSSSSSSSSSSSATETAQAAAEVAQQAADAAQAAADVTVNQQAAIWQEALLSPSSGTALVQAASICLSDPIYGIAQTVPMVNDNNIINGTTPTTMTKTTTVYLYWDSSFYFEVNLTAPYIQVIPVQVTVRPPLSPAMIPDVSPQTTMTRQDLVGSIVDWVLALLLLSMIGLGILVILQQVLGRNLRVIRRLFKYQRWFFDPLHYPFDSIYDNDDEDEENDAAEAAIEKEYALGGEDVIPLSMGGVKRRSDYFRDEEDEHGGMNGGIGDETEPTNGEDVLAWHDASQNSGALSSLGDVELVSTTTARDLTTPSPLAFGDAVATMRERSLSNESGNGLNTFMDTDSQNNNNNGVGGGDYHTDDMDIDNQSARSGMSGGGGSGHTTTTSSSSPPSRRTGSRLFRDPALVDLPNLTSSSKVAVPVGMMQNPQQQQQHQQQPRSRPPSRTGSFA